MNHLKVLPSIIFIFIFSLCGELLCKNSSEESKIAKNLIEKLGSSGIKTFRSASDDKKAFIDVYNDYFDEDIIAKSVFTMYRSLNDSQKVRFKQAFVRLQAKTYGSQFSKYPDAKLIVGKVVSQKKGRYEIYSKMSGSGFSDITVTWLVHFKGKSKIPLIYDVKVEDVSMVINKRNEINQELKKVGGNLESIVKRIEELGK